MGEHPDMTAKTLHPLSPATLFAASFLVFSGAACAVDAAAASASAVAPAAEQGDSDLSALVRRIDNALDNDGHLL